MEQPENTPTQETFRDSLGIVSKEGKRRWIYPKQPRGPLYRWRTILSVFLLVFLFGAPFVTLHAHPFILFNVLERKFILFGLVFGPHDFYLFGLVILTIIVFIILFTVVFGRLFCGWVCPQTVFMEMVFRRIDYWVEGDYRRQQRLNESPWTSGKVVRKSVKYLLSFIVAFFVGNTFVAYIMGVEELYHVVSRSPQEHMAAFTAVVGFSLLFYWIFVWFREQACILVCPYGRLQGVLLDRNSIVIAYDYMRGEPRGKLRRNEQRVEGDCIDCHVCVDVCPTGIDIRNGTQLECVNCTACIDACDEVMEKIDRPRRLIRYASAEEIAKKSGFRWTSRIIGYSAVLVFLVSLVTYLLAARTDYDVTILRTPGMFYQELPDGRVSNVYDVKTLNKTFEAVPLTLRLQQPPGEIQIVGNNINLDAQGSTEVKALIILDRSALKALTTPVTVEVYARNMLVEVIATSFLGPGTTR